MEIDPVSGVAGVTSGASGSGLSGTGARRRTPGRWRRIPRAIDLPEKVGLARLPELAPMMAGPSEKLWKATRRAERYDPSPSMGRMQQTAVGQKNLPPSFRFDIVSDQKNPPTVEDQTIPPTSSAEIEADQKSAERSDPSRLPQERPILQVDVNVVVKGSIEWEQLEQRKRQTLLQQAKCMEEEADEGLCDTEEHTEEDKTEFRASRLQCAAVYRHMATTKPVFIFKPPSDTIEEHLSAEEMERQAHISGWPVCSQAQHFATLALEWYNTK